MGMTTTHSPAIPTTTVKAEDAPIGVQLWPTRTPAGAVHFTLLQVRTVRTAATHNVVWHYEDGKTRSFRAGEQVVIWAR
jgi:hypothetical protein